MCVENNYFNLNCKQSDQIIFLLSGPATEKNTFIFFYVQFKLLRSNFGYGGIQIHTETTFLGLRMDSRL